MRKVSGYMTVEASFVVPLVICVFAFLIYLANFMYARCIVNQDCYILAFRASREAEPAKYVEEKSSRFGKKYFGSERPVFKVIEDKKTVTVKAVTRTSHKAAGILFPGLKREWKIKASQSAKKRDTPGHIRTIKRAIDLSLDKNEIKENE